ncbi:MAG: dicarboxylate/amino acid:cation symporter [Gemmatimonadota bacterium]|nr:dicarboxylate/amino acid:cation symporter [Gemmatimonadota bacterium]
MSRFKRVVSHLTFQVLTAITLGVLLGIYFPGTAKQMKPIGDTFVNLVKMVIAPIIFLTIVLGIANMGDLKKLGRVGGKALLYFEIVTTFALAIGIIVVNVIKPGAGLDVTTLATGDVSRYAAAAQKMSVVDFFTHIVPQSVVGAFAEGDILQVVFIAVLFGIAMAGLGDLAKPLARVLEVTSKVFFRIVSIVMRVAPIGAFGAMAYTVGNFGLHTLVPLGKLMLSVYTTMFLFVFVVLGSIARIYHFSLWKYLKFIREEIVLVLGTSSSEAALPGIIAKMERFGCAKPVVGLVIPAGYSFNLDGTSIYLSMAAIFLAQVYNVPLTIGQQIGVLTILMLTSKGAAGVTGSGFIVLASTLSAMQLVPIGGIALLLGVDRFMSEARAIVNLIGNGVATIVVSKSEGAFDEEQNRLALTTPGADIGQSDEPFVAAPLPTPDA